MDLDVNIIGYSGRQRQASHAERIFASGSEYHDAVKNFYVLQSIPKQFSRSLYQKRKEKEKNFHLPISKSYAQF